MPLENADTGLSDKFSIQTFGPNKKIVALEYDPASQPKPWRAFEQRGHGVRQGGSGVSLDAAITDLERVKVNMSNGDEIFALVKKLAQTEGVQAIANQSAPLPTN